MHFHASSYGNFVTLIPISFKVPTIVPLLTHAYGLSSACWLYICNVYANTSVAFIEKLALWDGPALLMLIAAMVVMAIELAS